MAGREAPVGALSRAIAEERWELAALCLLLGAVKVIEGWPPDTVTGLLDALVGDEDGGSKRVR
ncbi:MAG: hypothetical protein HW403_1491 [Dehalococcoidia bacterium]|nr:hypothetical protein [Dehalococcoidia bacterium]